mmetsp:Transcript_73354/g.196918  ORF Transcript_73354/g.196918 Transcript_73354/m.196918 type:complete len:367 (-) Transcript_73354:91-1191(-)
MTVSLVFLLHAGLAMRCLGAAPRQIMKAAVVKSRSWDFKFHLDLVGVMDVDVPEPGHGEALVHVYASNINPVDHKIVQMAGLLWSYPHKLGSDLAGVVVKVGAGCERIKVGDEVWGEATAWGTVVSTGGTYAQFASVSESNLGVKPKSLGWLEAGAMPMVALTGYDALTWAAGARSFPRRNTTVLILGGSGGTGHVGIQLAKAMGASDVITTCSGAHADFVKSLGADRVIDYHKQNYWEVLPPKSVDVVYDCVGLSGTGDQAFPILKDHGSFVSLLPTAMPSISTKFKRPDVYMNFPTCVGACSNYDRIDKISALVGLGKLKVHLDNVFQLSDIVKAYNESLGGHTTGKVALQISTDRTAGDAVMV